MREEPESKIEFRGALDTVRSDGRERRTLLEWGVLAADLGAGGIVHAAQEEKSIGNDPPASSLVTTSINEGRAQGERRADAYYWGVASSSDGRVAISRYVTTTRKVPPFLSDAIDALRSTTVPVLVPPEEPPGTGGLVPSAEEESYRLLFTNDPGGELAHAQQVNVFVEASTGAFDPAAGFDSQPVDVRGTDGRFFCGASACFLTWQEVDVTYLVGEFGADDEAVAFAESLVPIANLAGPLWREGKTEPTSTPELVVRDPGGNERLLESVEGFCECGFRPLDWSSENDRLLVLASAEGSTTLQEYRADGSGEPAAIAEGAADPEGRDVILDAAYGPNGIVALFGGEGGPPGTLQQLDDGGDVLAADVRAFDIEGSTLAYAGAAGDVIVRDLSTGNERTVGDGAIDVSVAPDVIRGASAEAAPSEDGGFPALLVAMIAVGGLALLGGVALFLLARRRQR